MSSEIESAYKYCETVTKRHAKTFYFAARFLPPSKRKPIYAVYALCRHVDDEVDEAEIASEAQAVKAVDDWKAKLDAIYQNQSRITNYELRIAEDSEARISDSNIAEPTSDQQNLVLIAWKDLLETYKIAQNLPLELMKGVLQDTHTNRYETFDELYVYCYRVASTVGLMASEIFGYDKPETLEYAEALGIAMQLTNILRDVKEDAAMNRIYLPQEDLRRFGVSERQIFTGERDENFVALIKFQIERARHYYRKSYTGIPLLRKDARFTVLLALRLYGKILDEIEKHDYNIFARRAHTGKTQKIFAVPQIWFEAKKL